MTPDTCPHAHHHGTRRPDWCCWTCGWTDPNLPTNLRTLFETNYTRHLEQAKT